MHLPLQSAPAFLLCVAYAQHSGSPGINFPIFASIPETSFSCAGRADGYYADQEARCQAYHMCASDTKYSFLCPNETLFSQIQLTCDWYNIVDCDKAHTAYDLNIKNKQASFEASKKYEDGPNLRFDVFVPGEGSGRSRSHNVDVGRDTVATDRVDISSQQNIFENAEQSRNNNVSFINKKKNKPTAERKGTTRSFPTSFPTRQKNSNFFRPRFSSGNSRQVSIITNQKHGQGTTKIPKFVFHSVPGINFNFNTFHQISETHPSENSAKAPNTKLKTIVKSVERTSQQLPEETAAQFRRPTILKSKPKNTFPLGLQETPEELSPARMVFTSLKAAMEKTNKDIKKSMKPFSGETSIM
jgi:hypothetical protein